MRRERGTRRGWWRIDRGTVREARADLPLLLCLGVLLALLTGATAAAPPLLDRLAGRALDSRIDETQRAGPGMEFSATLGALAPRTPLRATGLEDDLAAVGQGLADSEPALLENALRPASVRAVLPPAEAVVNDEKVALTLLYADDAPTGAAYAEGRPPRAIDDAAEVALSTRARDTLGLRLGQRVRLASGGASDVVGGLVVVGFFEPGDTRLTRELPIVAGPLTHAGQNSGYSAEAMALTSGHGLETLQNPGEAELSATWRIRLEPDGGAATRFGTDRGMDRLQRALFRYQESAGQDYCSFGLGGMSCAVGPHRSNPFVTSSPLPDALALFGRHWTQVRGVIAFALASLICVGLATCVVTALLAVRRRLPAHRLQRARGASALGLAAARAAQTGPVAAAGLAAGLLAASLLAPGGGAGPAYGQALAVAGVGWLLLPALTWYAVRDTAPRGHGADRRRAVARRLTVEAGVLLLAVGGVAALRSRGLGGGPDPQLAAVPALLGLATVMLLVRCYPPSVRLAARIAARRRGAVPLIALSGAAKDAPARALALLVLVVTLATGVFGSLVTATVVEGRRTAADLIVGADAALVGAGSRPEAAERVARTPGVRHTVRVWRTKTDPISTRDGGRSGPADLVGVDAAALLAAVPGSAAGLALRDADTEEPPGPPVTEPAKEHATGPDPGPRTEIRVLAEAGAATPGQTYRTRLLGRDVHLRVVGGLPDAVLRDAALGPVRTPGTPLLLADTSQFRGLDLRRVEDEALLLYGSAIDTDLLRAAVPLAGADSPAGDLRIRADEERRIDRDGVLAALTTAYTLSSVLAVLFALLALVLDLRLSAPERGRTAAQLRTLGLDGRAARSLHPLRLLPMVVAAAAGGAALGAVLPVLLGPALELRELTGGPGEPVPHIEYLPTLALGAGFVVLIAVAVAVETWRAGRRGLGAVLRLGEDTT